MKRGGIVRAFANLKMATAAFHSLASWKSDGQPRTRDDVSVVVH